MITAERALAIAKQAVAKTFDGDVEELFVPPYGVPTSDPPRHGFFRSWPEQPVWWVRYSPGSSGWMLQSSRLIVVAMRDGEILYWGSACDEG